MSRDHIAWAANKNQIAAQVPMRPELPRAIRVELSINNGFDTTPTSSVWPGLRSPRVAGVFVNGRLNQVARRNSAARPVDGIAGSMAEHVE
jgi:hypothetical protein